MTAPAARNLETTVASLRGRRPASSGEPHSVGQSAVSMMSLTATGTPCSGPIGRPLLRQSSLARACVNANSGSRCANALTVSSAAAIRSRHARVTSSDEAAPLAIAAAVCAAVSADKSLSANATSPASVAVEVVGQPQSHARPEIHDDHAKDDDQHVRHHAIEDLVERDVLGCDALEVER